jgi:alkylated DNA repair protein alkB family protein 1
MYYPDRYDEFPRDLSKLCKYIANVLGYRNFTPEAGIVNYYHMDSTLAGHTDHSELDHDAPLISIR